MTSGTVASACLGIVSVQIPKKQMNTPLTKEEIEKICLN